MHGDFAALDGFKLSEEQIAELFADQAFQEYLDDCNVGAMIDEVEESPWPWADYGGEG